MERIEETIS